MSRAHVYSVIDGEVHGDHMQQKLHVSNFPTVDFNKREVVWNDAHNRRISRYSSKACDFLSGCISMIALIVVIAYLGVKADPNNSRIYDEIVVWKTVVHWTKESTCLASDENGTTSGTLACKSYQPLYENNVNDVMTNLQVIPRADDNEVVHLSYGANILIEPYHISGLWMLFWIFLWSVVFQWYRATWPVCGITCGTNTTSNGRGYDDSVNTHPVLAEWNDQGPDASRWLEYAFTSPLQIVLIAGTGSIGDESTLIALFAAQLALVMLGYSNELQIDRITMCDYQSRGQAKLTLFVMFVLAAAVHVFIWMSLYSTFDLQISMAEGGGLEDNEGLKTLIRAIYYSQTVLFSLFGFVQLLHVLLVLFFENSYSYLERLDDYGNKKDVRWAYIAKVYSLLSVVTKTLLEILYLATILGMPEVKAIVDAK